MAVCYRGPPRTSEIAELLRTTYLKAKGDLQESLRDTLNGLTEPQFQQWLEPAQQARYMLELIDPIIAEVRSGFRGVFEEALLYTGHSQPQIGSPLTPEASDSSLNQSDAKLNENATSLPGKESFSDQNTAAGSQMCHAQFEPQEPYLFHSMLPPPSTPSNFIHDLDQPSSDDSSWDQFIDPLALGTHSNHSIEMPELQIEHQPDSMSLQHTMSFPQPAQRPTPSASNHPSMSSTSISQRAITLSWECQGCFRTMYKQRDYCGICLKDVQHSSR